MVDTKENLQSKENFLHQISNDFSLLTKEILHQQQQASFDYPNSNNISPNLSRLFSNEKLPTSPTKNTKSTKSKEFTFAEEVFEDSRVHLMLDSLENLQVLKPREFAPTDHKRGIQAFITTSNYYVTASCSNSLKFWSNGEESELIKDI